MDNAKTQKEIEEKEQEQRQREALAREEARWRAKRGYDVVPTDNLGTPMPSELYPNEGIGSYDDF